MRARGAAAVHGRMGTVKVRIGIGLGGAAGPDEFAAAVDRVEETGVDSLWLSEVVFGPLVEPFVGMTHALARTARLKVGTGVSVLPGRNPVLVAKQLASLAGLAPRRVLPVFGLQPARPRERALFPVPAGRRGAVFDESLELLRLLLRQETVSFAGEFFAVEAASVGPPPAEPLDIWLGGSAPARCAGSAGSATAGSPALSPRRKPARGARPSRPPPPQRAAKSILSTSGSASRWRRTGCPPS